ncbi:MAG: GNAT family N-acetyltransferase [Actinomycetota bacterium]
MNEPVALTEADAPQIAAFTRVACPYDLLTTTSVRRSIFADPDPQHAIAMYAGGLDAVGVGVVRERYGYVKFLSVHPVVRRTGVGSHLLDSIEAFCQERGARSIDVGTSAPYYVVPGIDVRLMEAAVLLTRSGYEKTDEAVNLSVPLRDLAEPPLLVSHAGTDELEAIRPWVTEHFPNWINELERGVALGNCVVHRDLGFACWDVNREGWFGPIATIPDAGRGGIGTSTLLGALHAMRARGYEHADIAWATAHEFYAKAVGARIGRVFWSYRKVL